MLTFNFTIDEINVILTGLGDQPYKTVAQLISKIHSQANPQMQTSAIPQGFAQPNVQAGGTANPVNPGADRQPLVPPSYAA